MTITSDPLREPQTKNVEATAPSEEDLRLLFRCKNAYQQARAAKKNLLSNWRRNWLLLNNRMWSDFRQSWMPSPSDSEIFPILANYIGWLTDQAVMFTVQEAALPNTPWAQYLQSLADDLETLLQSNWKVRNQQGVITLCLWDASLYGCGIMKSVWDQSLDNGLGDANIVHVDPWNFYPDPQATNEEDGDYFIEVRRMDWEEIERRFPDTFDRLLADILYDSSDQSLDSDSRPTNVKTGPSQYPMSMTQGYPTPATSSTGLPGQGRIKTTQPDGVVVYELWHRRNRDTTVPDPYFDPTTAKAGEKAPDVEVIYDDWEVVIWSSNTVLMKAWASDLWDGATHPYGRLAMEDTGEFWPTPVVSHLAPAQIAINRLLAALQQSAELTGNPIFIEPAAAGIAQTTITNRPGQRLRIPTAGMQGGGPSWMQPPSMSPDVLNLIRFWIERMENISGLSAVQKGRSAAPRTPESVVSQVQESGFVRVRAVLRNMERVLRRLGTIQAQLIIENYTTERIVSIVGSEGERNAVALRERHFIDAVDNEYAPFKFSLLINAGSDVPTSRQARVSEAQNLFLIKAIDRPALLEAVNFPHWPIIQQRMEQAEKEAAEQAAQQQAQGRGNTKRKS